jgi:putative redox protein
MAMPFEKVSFPGSSGEPLAGRLELPQGETQAYALFAHCFTCSKDVFAAHRIARRLAERGVGVLRFDFTGLGASGGDFANSNFSSNVEDLVRAADFLRTRHAAPRLLVGHSLGGAAILAAAHRIPEAAAVATIGAPAEPAHVMRNFAEAVPEIERQGDAEVRLAGRSFRIRKQFLEDIARHRLDPLVAGLGKALLIFHAPTDEVVGLDNARRLYELARHPKSFIALDGADHLLTRREDATYVADILAAWAHRFLGAAGGEDAEVWPAPREGGVVVQEAGADPAAGRGALVERVAVGRHRLLADEPVEQGGTDRGPNPYDLLLAALGSCTAMTMRLYADRKGWPLRRSTVILGHRKIHAVDCADCETKDGKIDLIERTIALEGALDASQRERLLEIAEKCPVHRTLHGEVKVVSRLAPP